jgi:hypothetical protein
MKLVYDLWLWYFTWWLVEGHETAERLLASDDDTVPSELRAGAAVVAAIFSWALGDLDRIPAESELGIALSTAAGDSEKLALALMIGGAACQADPDRGRALLAAASDAAAASGDIWTRAMIASCASLYLVLIGDGDAAVASGRTAVVMFQSIGGTRQLSLAELGVGLGLMLVGELDDAAETLETVFIDFVRVANWKLASMAGLGAALTARLRGNAVAARELYEQSYWVSQQNGDLSNVPLCLEGVAATVAAEDPVTAARLLGAAHAAFETGRVPTMPGFEALAASTHDVLSELLGARLETLLAEGARGRGVVPASRAPDASLLEDAEVRSPRERGAVVQQ